ncbi:MAG: hypothetical protein FJ288_07545 [Planctomycetes bacterium]|nr:hypothetical protein [Planctomycetota bacterium]
MHLTSPALGRRIIVIGLGLLAAVLVAVALLKWTPDVYRRTAAVGPDDPARGRFNEEVLNRIGNVLLDRSGRTRLELAVTEEMASARLAAVVDEEERAGRTLPAAVRNLRVGFEPGCVVLATRIGRGITSVVISQHLRLEAMPDGALRIEPAGLRAGLVPLPSVLLQDACRTLARRTAAGRAAEDEKSIDFTQYFLEALEGRPVFLGSGRKRILLERVQADRGVLRVEGRRADAPQE